MGRVVKAIVGCDGNIRSVELIRGDGKVCHHSINHLYPLEISLTHSSNAVNSNSNSAKEVEKVPPRAAALKCRELMREQLGDNED